MRCIFQTPSLSSSDFEIYEHRGSRAAIADRASLKGGNVPLLGREYLRRNFCRSHGRVINSNPRDLRAAKYDVGLLIISKLGD